MSEPDTESIFDAKPEAAKRAAARLLGGAERAVFHTKKALGLYDIEMKRRKMTEQEMRGIEADHETHDTFYDVYRGFAQQVRQAKWQLRFIEWLLAKQGLEVEA